ncbi:hypothetical protein SAMN04489796_11342 [Winogradskyella thalassocola]|uniref:Uncharacterized protein n=1 Tax=Winogradskyella thalassocola TaxID=262004 RepID=A0A1G8LPA7_9FLAO|nr:hypothetical protein SAMN04489796_11342 [Winogradskyella thalassocola]
MSGWGKQITCFSAIFVANPYSFWYGVPFYILGLLLLWNSKLTKNLKIKWSLYPVFIVGIVYSLISLFLLII